MNKINWKEANPIAFATVNVYVGKSCQDFKNGFLDKANFIETSRHYLKDDETVILLNNSAYESKHDDSVDGLQPLEHLFVYLLQHADPNIENMDQLIECMNKIRIVDRGSNAVRQIDGKSYHRLCSSSTKRSILYKTRYIYQGWNVKDDIYVPATDKELFKLYNELAERGIEHHTEIRTRLRKNARQKYDFDRYKFSEIKDVLF